MVIFFTLNITSPDNRGVINRNTGTKIKKFLDFFTAIPYIIEPVKKIYVNFQSNNP